MIKVTTLKSTKSKCYACSTNGIVRVEQGNVSNSKQVVDRKNICAWHVGQQPKDVREAVELHLNPPVPVTESEAVTA